MASSKHLLQIHIAVFLFGLAGLFGKLVALPAAIIVLGRVFFGSISLFIIMKVTARKMKLGSMQAYGMLSLLGIILLTGVRTMMMVAFLSAGYFLFISGKVSIKKKLLIVGSILLLTLIFMQFEPGRKVIEEQTKYIEILQGKGNKHNKTTLDFRSAMWGEFWNKLTSSNERMLNKI